MADEDLRYAWRGETLPGGAKEGWLVGEEEFLRQEAISNEGKVNPMGDPMKRKIVGSILSKLDLSRELPAPAGTPNRNSASNVDTVISEETTLKRNELEGFVFPSVHAWQPQPRHRQRASPLSALDKSATHANEYGSAEVQGMVDHPHALGKRTIKTTGFRQKQARLSQTRRLIGGKRPVSCESSCSDSDETIGHSQSMESTQELGAPFNRGGSTATDFGPLSPLSLESIDLVKSSIITCRRDSILKRKRYSDHHMDMDDAFDLTVAPAIPSSRLHSEVRQPPTPRVHGLIDSQSEADLNYFEASLPSVARTTPLQHTHTSLKPERRRYTFGDCFCGAGGMSRGAINAGLCIIWGFDFDRVACETYAMNFFGTPVYNVWANEFANGKGDYKCDICHLSPPCQFWSIAHTIQGKDDEMNTASLFAILRLLERAKPRVVTLEQTAGLIRRHPLFFNAVINMFTSRGFSVRWRVLNCADFGVPQRRMRLFIIASCPGEPLPPFPNPTHSSTPTTTGLKPHTTITSAIASIPPNWPNHNIHTTKPRNAAPTSGDTIAACITTNGGPGNVHPSGDRNYTQRELACLQTFQLGHAFGGVGVKRQIGNAVPPVMATAVLEAVKRSMLVADGLA